MKRSKHVQLSLASAVSVAIAGCNAPEPTRTIQQSVNFQSVQQCTAASIPVDICSSAYMTAMAEHQRIAPTYDSEGDCEADFVEDYCEVDSSGHYIPRMSGFEIAAEGTVTESQWENANARAGGGGFDSGDLLMGLLIGNMLSNMGGRYYSAPVYRYRDSRGAFSTSTLGRRIENGTVFSRSRQARYGQGYTSSRVQSSIRPKAISVPSATSRGGFGSQSSARSGWGGSRSFGG